MKTIKFEIISSSNNCYEVTFSSASEKFTSSCTCAAAEHGQLCKHRLELLHGDISSITSGNEYETTTVFSWLEGTAVAEALKQVSEAEKNYESAKKNLSTAKKHLSRLLNG